MTVGQARLCPPSEVLAAFVDAKLPQPQVVRLTEHLAGCAECRMVVEDAAEEEMSVVVGGSQKKPATWQWMSVAAVIGVGVLLTPTAKRVWDIRQRDNAVREMMATSPGDERTIEPRVTGGFPYKPHTTFRAANPEKIVPPQQLIFEGKASDVLERTEHDRTPAGKHARGIAFLELNRANDAIDSLTAFTNLHPNDASGWSDLAAARYLNADYAGARAAAERAIQLDPNLNEAWFNRALAMNTMPAWSDYLRHDPNGPWADEARRKIDLLSLK